MKLLSLNVLLMLLTFFFVGKVNMIVIYAIIAYIFVSTPVYVILTYLKLKKELKSED